MYNSAFKQRKYMRGVINKIALITVFIVQQFSAHSQNSPYKSRDVYVMDQLDRIAALRTTEITKLSVYFKNEDNGKVWPMTGCCT